MISLRTKRTIRWLGGMVGGLDMQYAGKIVHTDSSANPAKNDTELLENPELVRSDDAKFALGRPLEQTQLVPLPRTERDRELGLTVPVEVTAGEGEDVRVDLVCWWVGRGHGPALAPVHEAHQPSTIVGDRSVVFEAPVAVEIDRVHVEEVVNEASP